MNKWTILGGVVCFTMLVINGAEARTMRYSGGCANGQCGMSAVTEAAPAAPTTTQAIPTSASEDSTKVETTDAKPVAPAVSAAPQMRTSFGSGRMFRFRRAGR